MADTETRNTHHTPDPRGAGNTVTTDGPASYPPVEDLVTVDHQTIEGDGTTANPLRAIGGTAFALLSVQFRLGNPSVVASDNIADLTGSAGAYDVTLSTPTDDQSRMVVTCGCAPHPAGGGEGPGFKAGAAMNVTVTGPDQLHVEFWALDSANTPIDPGAFWLRVDLATLAAVV